MSTPLSPKLDWSLMNPILASTLNPLISNPINSTLILKSISLVSGTNVVNHGLGKNMQGWFITDINGAATIYRNAPFNNKKLSLFSNASVTVDIGVF